MWRVKGMMKGSVGDSGGGPDSPEERGRELRQF